MELTGKKLVIAHRGASAYAPENTLPAFSLAADMNAFGVELDVHMTADGQVVVIHDDDISRVSNGEGKVREMTLAELRKFSYASRFADEYDKVDIPTLEDVYRLLGPRGLYVNVEIKASGKEFIKKVHDIAIECGMRERVFYSSFDHNNLVDMLEYDPEAFTAPLYGTQIVCPADYAKLFGAKAIHPHHSQLTAHPEIIARANELGVRVHPWTVNSPDSIRRLFEIGIHAIITDKPDVALEIASSVQ